MIYSSHISPVLLGLEIGALPVRKIKPRAGRRTMPGWFPTFKGTLPALRTETLLELDALGHFEVNPECLLMAAQPHRLDYHEPVPGGRGTIIRSYTPDLAMLMRDGGVVVVDFKIAKYARRDDWTAKEAVLKEAYWRDHFVVFETVTDESIYVQPRHANVGVMLAHKRAVPDDVADVAVMTAIGRLGLPTTIDAVRAAVSLPARHAHEDRAFSALVAMALDGRVRFDLGIPLLAPGAPVLRYAPAPSTGIDGRRA